MKEIGKGAIHDEGWEGGKYLGTKEHREKWGRKGDGHSIGNYVFKEEEDDREDTQSV